MITLIYDFYYFKTRKKNLNNMYFCEDNFLQFLVDKKFNRVRNYLRIINQKTDDNYLFPFLLLHGHHRDIPNDIKISVQEFLTSKHFNFGEKRKQSIINHIFECSLLAGSQDLVDFLISSNQVSPKPQIIELSNLAIIKCFELGYSFIIHELAHDQRFDLNRFQTIFEQWVLLGIDRNFKHEDFKKIPTTLILKTYDNDKFLDNTKIDNAMVILSKFAQKKQTDLLYYFIVERDLKIMLEDIQNTNFSPYWPRWFPLNCEFTDQVKEVVFKKQLYYQLDKNLSKESTKNTKFKL